MRNIELSISNELQQHFMSIKDAKRQRTVQLVLLRKIKSMGNLIVIHDERFENLPCP